MSRSSNRHPTVSIISEAIGDTFSESPWRENKVTDLEHRIFMALKCSGSLRSDLAALDCNRDSGWLLHNKVEKAICDMINFYFRRRLNESRIPLSQSIYDQLLEAGYLI